MVNMLKLLLFMTSMQLDQLNLKTFVWLSLQPHMNLVLNLKMKKLIIGIENYEADVEIISIVDFIWNTFCLLYTSPSPRAS